MKPEDKIKKLIKESDVMTGSDEDKRILAGALEHLGKLKQKNLAVSRPNIWRKIMKSPKAKITAAAAVLVVAVLSLTMFKQTAEPVWAIEQTVKALRDIETIVITGDDYYSSGSVPFKCSFRLSGRDSGLFDMRFESETSIIVVRGTKAWEYRPKENFVRIYQNVMDSEGMMRDLGFWYKVASLNPWLTGKILGKLKLFTDDWEETYGRDERTQRECVFVKCSYEPLSFLLTCDLENKLIVEATYWTNPDHKGPPSLHATGFSYNQEINDGGLRFSNPGRGKSHRQRKGR